MQHPFCSFRGEIPPTERKEQLSYQSRRRRHEAGVKAFPRFGLAMYRGRLTLPRITAVGPFNRPNAVALATAILAVQRPGGPGMGHLAPQISPLQHDFF